MTTKSLQSVADDLNSVGWFVPPYVSVGLLETVANTIHRSQGTFCEDDLERVLAFIYTPDRMASMVVSRYPSMPVVSLYQRTIAEGIYAHFAGLHHVAIGGLIPVVEGIGRELARERGLQHKRHIGIQRVFHGLLLEAKDHAIRHRIGATQEIVDMLDAFLQFLKKFFFEDSQLYPLRDKTNRHGIVHGVYRDADYGRPMNFYKLISAIDILTFVSMLQTPKKSGLAPDWTKESKALAERYRTLQKI